MSKPLRTRLGHFRIKVRKCSVDTSEVLFGGVQRTLPNLYSEVSYATTFLFNPVFCRFHWLISSFSCSQMILHIYLITVCTYFEPGRPWADIIQEINKKSKNSNFLLFTKWLPDLDCFTAWITLGIGLRGHFRIKVRKCPEPLPRAGNSTSNWAVQNAQNWEIYCSLGVEHAHGVSTICQPMRLWRVYNRSHVTFPFVSTSMFRAHLHQASASTLRPLCDYASDSVLVEINGDAWKWVATLFCSVTAVLSQHWRWRLV